MKPLRDARSGRTPSSGSRRRRRLLPRAPRWARLDDPRHRRSRVALAVLVALGSGAVLGLQRTTEPGANAAASFDETVAPLLREVDTLWGSGRDGRPPIGAAVTALRQAGPPPDAATVAGWLEAHDTLLVRIVGADVPLAARGAQRQGIIAVTLSRDAVEVLGRAAQLPSGAARDELVAESIRLRLRSEQVTLAVEASVDDLRGERRRLSVLPQLPGFAELVG
jgi:hypothetical protein